MINWFKKIDTCNKILLNKHVIEVIFLFQLRIIDKKRHPPTNSIKPQNP